MGTNAKKASVQPCNWHAAQTHKLHTHGDLLLTAYLYLCMGCPSSRNLAPTSRSRGSPGSLWQTSSPSPATSWLGGLQGERLAKRYQKDNCIYDMGLYLYIFGASIIVMWFVVFFFANPVARNRSSPGNSCHGESSPCRLMPHCIQADA